MEKLETWLVTLALRGDEDVEIGKVLKKIAEIKNNGVRK